MLDRFRSYFKQLFERWNGLERKYRIRIIAIASMLVVAIGVTIFLVSRPRMVELYPGLEYQTLVSIEAALSSAVPPIDSKVTTAPRAIQVRAQDMERAVVIAESQNLVSEYQITYQDLIDYSSMTASATTMSEISRKAMESDLEKVIKNIKGVNQALVRLALPQVTSYFMDASETKKATAGITLNVDGSFDKTSGEAIARIISRAVPNLKMEDVEIIDQYASTIYSSSDSFGMGGYKDNLEAQRLEEERMRKRVSAYLAAFSTSVQCMVNLQYDWNKKDSSSKTYTNPTGEENSSGLISSELIDKSTYENTPQEGAPGIDTNNNQTQTYQTESGDNSSARTDHQERTFLHNETVETVAGSVGVFLPEKSSMSAIIFNERVITQEYAEKNNIMGNLNWEQFKDANDRKVVAVADFDADGALLSSLKIGTGIDNIALSAYSVTLCQDRVVKPINIEQIIIFAILAVMIFLIALSLLRVAKPDEEVVIEPELSVEDLLVSTRMEEVKKTEAEKLAEIEFGGDSEIKKHIDKFVADRPEAVAQLLRSWLNEDWE